MPNNVCDLGKIIVATSFEWLPKVQKSPNLVTLVGDPRRRQARKGVERVRSRVREREADVNKDSRECVFVISCYLAKKNKNKTKTKSK